MLESYELKTRKTYLDTVYRTALRVININLNELTGLLYKFVVGPLWNGFESVSAHSKTYIKVIQLQDLGLAESQTVKIWLPTHYLKKSAIWRVALIKQLKGESLNVSSSDLD